jgi:hypothetical protein
LTEATASGGAAVAAEIEEKKNTTSTVLGIYRAMKTTSRRRAAHREHAEARAGGRRHTWKAFEARRRWAGGGAMRLAVISKYLQKCHWLNFLNYSQIF